MAESTKIIYSMMGVTKSYDRKTVLKEINLSYFYGAKIGLLGLNGSGKSTLMKILAGVDKNFEGEIQISPGYTVGYLEQEPKFPADMTVREVVEQGAKATTDMLKEYDAINEKFAEPMDDDEMTKLLDKLGKIQEKLDMINAWDLDAQLDMAMDALRCPPDDATMGTLSGGEIRRVALVRLLLLKPDVLLLDEPTNHLDAESINWLEQHLQRYAGTIIAITHDRYFLDNVAGWILELDRGEGHPFKGNYTDWLKNKQKRLAVEASKETAKQRELKRELEWIGHTPQGRQKKSKSRISSYEDLLDQKAEKVAKDIQIYIPAGPRLGQVVITAKNLAKAFGDRLLYDDLNFELPPGGIIGIVGPNGAGKTTLFRMITKMLEPDAGTIQIGDTVEIACAQQGTDDLNPKHDVWQAVSGGNEEIKLGKVSVNSRAYLARFSFTGTDQSKLVSELSGGERHRIQLANTLKEGCNVLLLDEPTNDMDVNTIRALEEALLNFAGCAVVISHDRWFLDRTATHILAFEGGSNVIWHEGNFSSYDIARKKRLGIEADQPHRIKYRKLTRN